MTKRTKEEIKARQKEYRIKNKERINAKIREHYYKNRERKVEYSRQYRIKNREAVLESVRISGKKSFLKHKLKIYKYRNERNKTDIQCKIKEILRKRLKSAVVREYKKGSAIHLLGCSIEFFKEYISKQFQEGMSWDNHGKFGWHIDHIKPCASFDLTKEEEQRKCFHYTNMQPLWAKENHSKGAKIL